MEAVCSDDLLRGILSYKKRVMFVLCVASAVVKLYTTGRSTGPTSMSSAFPPMKLWEAMRDLTSALVSIISTGVQLWCVWYILVLVFVWVPPAYQLVRANFGDDTCAPTDRAADYDCGCSHVKAGYHTWERDNADTASGESRQWWEEYRSPDPRELRLLMLVKKIREPIRALQSLWDFHRRTRTKTGGENWYRPLERPTSHETKTDQPNRGRRATTETQPITQRAQMMMERGHLVVCLTPSPDLVTASWLGRVNTLYQSYRAWQRWLLAHRVYRELESDQGKELGEAMFTSFSGFAEAVLGGQKQQHNPPGHGEVEHRDGERNAERGPYSLVVEMSVANSLQKGKWLL